MVGMTMRNEYPVNGLVEAVYIRPEAQRQRRDELSVNDDQFICGLDDVCRICGIGVRRDKGVNLHPLKIFDDQRGRIVSVHFADGN